MARTGGVAAAALLVLAASSARGGQPLLRGPSGVGGGRVEKSQNDSFVVFCSAGADDTVTWSGPNGRAVPLAAGRVHAEDKGAFGTALFFDRIELSDRGRYACAATRTRETAHFELAVVKMSQFLNTPTRQSVTEYSNAVIRCEADGEPRPTLSWQRDGRTLADGGEQRQQQSGGVGVRKYIPDARGLKIMNATKADSGVFTCRALQLGTDDGYIRTIDIALVVQHKPEWKDGAGGDGVSAAFGYEGGEANLTCEAAAQPPANYTWLRNSREVKDNALNVTVVAYAERSVLQIQVNNESFGHYQCQASNRLGKISRIFELRRGAKPPPPASVSTASVSVHGAQLALSATAVDGLVGFRVQFVVSPPGYPLNWDRPHFQDLVADASSGRFALTDLLEDTPYTYRVATRSAAGLSDYEQRVHQLRTLKAGQTGGSSPERRPSSWWWPIAVLLLATPPAHPFLR